MKAEIKTGWLDLSDWRHVLLITVPLSMVIVAVGVLSANVGVLGIVVVIAVFMNATPPIILIYQSYRQLKEMEEKFPMFLRDLIESIRSGTPFHKAILASSKIDYGTLSVEVRKMAHQISWGVTLDKALDRFAERVKASKRLYAATKIIRESFLSGGEVVSTLESVAESAATLEEAEKEKKSLLNQYVVLMYAISVIFVVIISAINKFLIPIFQSSGNTAAAGAVSQVVSLDNPCNTCTGFECNVCDMYSFVGSVTLGGGPAPLDLTSITVYYTSLFFLMAVIQAVLSGLVAGQISEGSIKAGIKHSLILSGISIGSFLIMIKMGFLGV